MQRKSYRIFLALVFAGLAVGFVVEDGWAWVRHNLMTYYTVQSLDWLDEYDQISVTPYTYRDDSLNPDFKIHYVNPDPAPISPSMGKFAYYTLESTERPGFVGAEVGSKTNARQILVDYSDEPDWWMDKKLKLSVAQKLMAGSQGYRHMYYPAWDWHLPYLFFPQGVAPKRARHFYKLAEQAFMKGDLYWGFRFLARAIHYIQDIGQPYHTTQTSLRFVILKSPISGTTQTTKNYHFAYESYVAYRLQQEAAGLVPANYITALKQPRPVKMSNTVQLLEDMAKTNNKEVGDTLRASVKLFGKGLRSTEEVPLTQGDVDSLMTHSEREEFDRTVRRAFSLASGGVLEFLESRAGPVLSRHNLLR